MTEFYSPKSQKVQLPSGRMLQLRRGIHPIPDELSNSLSAHDFGIKPVSEMTDAEWAGLGLTKPAPPQPSPAGKDDKVEDKAPAPAAVSTKSA